MNRWHQTPLDSRIVIDGVPGAGKTTFVKRLCYIWAQATGKGIIEDIPETFTVEDPLIIPIVLRLIKDENSLLDILLSQLSFLTVQEACSIVNLISEKPEKIILLLDGYDELKGSNVINKLLTKEHHSEVLCLTTSRPHAIEQLKRLTSQAIDHHIKLCGFSQEQVQIYIQNYFVHHFGNKEKADSLFSHILSERKEILEMAKVPIRCEMICIVWAEYGELGKTIADLYTLFILHLLSHMKQKYHPKSMKKATIEPYHDVLMKIGKLAYFYERKRLCIVFTTEQVQEHVGEYFEDVMKIGLITKSHPTSKLQHSLWSFPHLTIQEYMVSYYLAHADESSIQEFIDISKDLTALKRNTTILQFLCCKYPEKANKILHRIIQDQTEEKGCQELLGFIIGLLPHYKQSTVCLPLTKYVDTSQTDDEKEVLEGMKLLLDMDRRTNFQILRHLKIQELTDVNMLGQSYVTHLTLTVQEVVYSMAVNGLTAMTSLVDLDITVSDIDEELKKASILKSVCKTLDTLKVTGNYIFTVMRTQITRFNKLQSLTLDERSIIEMNDAIHFMIEVEKCPITSLTCCVGDLYLPLMSHTGKAALSLEIRIPTSKTLHDGVSELREQVCPVNIHKLDLNASISYKDFHDEGGALGELLVRIPHLEVLLLGSCKINKQTVDEMDEQIHKASSEPNLTQLDLSGNTLRGCGSSLGSLLYHLPHIQTLGLGGCKLTSSDLSDTAQALPESTNIHKLYLYGNDLDECKLTSSDLSDTAQALPESTNIHNLDLWFNDLEIRQESDDSDSSVYSYNEIIESDKMIERGLYKPDLSMVIHTTDLLPQKIQDLHCELSEVPGTDRLLTQLLMINLESGIGDKHEAEVRLNEVLLHLQAELGEAGSSRMEQLQTILQNQAVSEHRVIKYEPYKPGVIVEDELQSQEGLIPSIVTQEQDKNMNNLQLEDSHVSVIEGKNIQNYKSRIDENASRLIEHLQSTTCDNGDGDDDTTDIHVQVNNTSSRCIQHTDEPNTTDDKTDIKHVQVNDESPTCMTQAEKPYTADDAVCGGTRLLQHTPRLQALSVGGLDKTDPTRAVCAAVDTGALTHLRILDMTGSKLQTGSMELLGYHLLSLTELQALSLCDIDGAEAEDYLHVYKNVPESLQHLNVWSRDVSLDPYLLVEYKHQLRHLHRLNVNFDDTDLDMVQELMEEHNPHIHVYNEEYELIYDMYVTDKDKDK